MLRLLINIFIIYAVWQLLRMIFAVNKTQQKFHEKINEMDREMDKNSKSNKNKDNDTNDGEYIDYEEIK